MIDWIKPTEQLPKHGKKVIAAYKNRLGKWRRIMAMYFYRWTEEEVCYEYGDDLGDITECSEEQDVYFWKEGWYECIENWPEYSFVTVCEGEVELWTDAPELPEEGAE